MGDPSGRPFLCLRNTYQQDIADEPANAKTIAE